MSSVESPTYPPVNTMDKLVKSIEHIRVNLDGWRKRSLKETPTRTIVVDPLLEALGWDVRDPDEVELEYPTVGGKSVDYALKINRKAVLLVEAKPLDAGLKDVKAVAQVVAYAANDGIAWCVLTNGVHWQVYRSIEECPAPDKLMYEVSIDPRDSEGLTVQQTAEQLWRLSREEMAKGTLDALGEQTFTDGKVRKALDRIMIDAPRSLLNAVKAAAGDASLRPRKIKESLARIWTGATPLVEPQAERVEVGKPRGRKDRRRGAARTGRGPRRAKAEYDEQRHTRGKPKEVLELYRSIDRLCLSLKPGDIDKRYLAKCVSYSYGRHIFCSVHLLKGGLRVWLKLKYSRLESAPSFARDVSNIGHWGVGDLELAVTSVSQLDESSPLIRESFDAGAA